MIPIVIVAPGTVPKGLENRIGRDENRSTNRDDLDYRIVKIGQKTEKNPRDLKRLGVT